MTVDESDQDRSKREKTTQEADMELEDLVIETDFDRLQRCSDGSLAAQVQQHSDDYLQQHRFQGL